jgi:hypothetical protein
MLKTEVDHTAERPGVKKVLMWIERDVPGIFSRLHLDNKTTLVIPPGEPLDLHADASLFKQVMDEYVGLQTSLDADSRHYVQDLMARMGIPVKQVLGALLAAAVLTHLYYTVHHHMLEFHQQHWAHLTAPRCSEAQAPQQAFMVPPI